MPWKMVHTALNARMEAKRRCERVKRGALKSTPGVHLQNQCLRGHAMVMCEYAGLDFGNTAHAAARVLRR
jgi:hypothetical protein